jgi:hypothetical protein
LRDQNQSRKSLEPAFGAVAERAQKTHPYAEAVYRVVELSGGGFGVEVKTPESNPATVTRFETEVAAEAWIARNKQRVVEQSQPRTRFYKRRS